ncbi:unnamed protein product, partial [Meganyctiphanes norvegica]
KYFFNCKIRIKIKVIYACSNEIYCGEAKLGSAVNQRHICGCVAALSWYVMTLFFSYAMLQLSLHLAKASDLIMTGTDDSISSLLLTTTGTDHIACCQDDHNLAVPPSPGLIPPAAAAAAPHKHPPTVNDSNTTTDIAGTELSIMTSLVEAWNNSSSIWMNVSDGSLVNGTNDTSDGGSYIPYHQRPETYIVPVLFGVIFIVGVIGNGVLIGIFIRNATLRNVPNTYIISLAIGDLIVLLFTVPFVSTVYTFDQWPYGEFECKFSEFIRDISVGVTVFTLTALSADRYKAIVSPIRK